MQSTSERLHAAFSELTTALAAHIEAEACDGSRATLGAWLAQRIAEFDPEIHAQLVAYRGPLRANLADPRVAEALGNLPHMPRRDDGAVPQKEAPDEC